MIALLLAGASQGISPEYSGPEEFSDFDPRYHGKFLRVKRHGISIGIDDIDWTAQIGQRMQLFQKSGEHFVVVLNSAVEGTCLGAFPARQRSGGGTAWVTNEGHLIFGKETESCRHRFYFQRSERLPIVDETDTTYLVMVERHGARVAIEVPRNLMGTELDIRPVPPRPVVDDEAEPKRVVLSGPSSDAVAALPGPGNPVPVPVTSRETVRVEDGEEAEKRLVTRLKEAVIREVLEAQAKRATAEPARALTGGTAVAAAPPDCAAAVEPSAAPDPAPAAVAAAEPVSYDGMQVSTVSTSTMTSAKAFPVLDTATSDEAPAEPDAAASVEASREPGAATSSEATPERDAAIGEEAPADGGPADPDGADDTLVDPAEAAVDAVEGQPTPDAAHGAATSTVVVAAAVLPDIDAEPRDQSWPGLVNFLSEQTLRMQILLLVCIVEGALIARLRRNNRRTQPVAVGAPESVGKKKPAERGRAESDIGKEDETGNRDVDVHLSGSIAQFPVNQVIQLLSASAETGTLWVTLGDGSDMNKLLFLNGSLIDAAMGARRGMDVLVDVLVGDNGSFSFKREDTSANERHFSQDTMSLLLKATRLVDEIA